MVQKADELGLPLLGADFSMHFVELARAVIESSIQMQRERAEATTRVYDAHAAAVRDGRSPQERFAAAARAARHQVWLLDADDGQIVLASDPSAAVPDATDDAVSQLSLPTRPPTVFLARRVARAPASDGVLEHLASLAALECEHLARDRDRQRTSGAELLAALIDERLDLPAAWPELKHRNLGDAVVLVVARRADGNPLPHEDLQHTAPFRSSTPLLLHRSPLLFAVVPDDPALLQGLHAVLGTDARLGVSNRLGPTGNLRETLHEAHLALARAEDEAAAVVRYADQSQAISLVPRSVEECKTLVDAVLGPLIRYDEQHASELVTTLQTFVSLDRSAQVTADTLHVHRQTLTYRLRRIQELTGRSTSASADVAAFWLAFEAAARIGLTV
jgi:purine catabolism regulator